MSSDSCEVGECSLDPAGLSAQRARYGSLARHAVAVERGPGVVRARFDAAVPRQLVDKTVGIERSCCPFFGLEYAADERLLTITVEGPELDSRLEPLAIALSTSVSPAASPSGE